MARNLRPGFDWVPAMVVERLGPVLYLVETAGHQRWKRYLDHLKEFGGSHLTAHEPMEEPSSSHASESETPVTVAPPAVLPSTATPVSVAWDPIQVPPVSPAPSPGTMTPQPERRYPSRDRHSPDRFK